MDRPLFELSERARVGHFLVDQNGLERLGCEDGRVRERDTGALWARLAVNRVQNRAMKLWSGIEQDSG